MNKKCVNKIYLYFYKFNDVKNYDFYDENNIYCFDRNNPNIKIEFLNKDNTEIDDSIYKKYSLTQWIKHIFKEE